ncbi:hypothetical protein BO78DRAFT_80970 [Aspergillus sclerotiicarbonarius CBS 121057]|uniref:Uncharacterized protein n=1 Tax=Aspergillus sclerotiicarbonarius (strain CBS 121057 / IBT 28362) TaxID=1448318 RepID=A0A319EF24_ASPSB|nr:hypothetical protein BO78DRAFT_80970 [Aspergillus sclerotiicarbonarius CBS 121057]
MNMPPAPILLNFHVHPLLRSPSVVNRARLSQRVQGGLACLVACLFGTGRARRQRPDAMAPTEFSPLISPPGWPIHSRRPSSCTFLRCVGTWRVDSLRSVSSASPVTAPD